jgi:hypothetical protein
LNSFQKKQRLEEWIHTDRPELAIVEPQLYERTQKLLADGRRRNAPRPKHDYLLSRRVKCACGDHQKAEYEARLTLVRITDEDIDTVEKFCEEIRQELDEGGTSSLPPSAASLKSYASPLHSV